MRAFDEPVISPVIVGRDLQIGLLERLLSRDGELKGQAILLAGEAGIGKSRLIAAVRELARNRGCGLVEGSFFEQDRSLPYAGLTDLVRRHLLTLSPDEASALAVRIRDLAPLIPGLDLLDPTVRSEAAVDQDRRRLVAAFGEFLIASCQGMGLVAILEDLHWADDASLESLLDLARLTTNYPLLIFMTYRDDEVSPALGHLLAGLERERLASEIRLMRLQPADVDQMLRAILGRARPVRVEVLNAICGLTDGNPFFVEEVVRSLSQREGPAIWDEGLPANARIPRSVEESVQRRTASLSSSATGVLELAAVAGRRFDFPLLLRLSGLDEDGLLAAIKDLLAAQLVVEESEEQFSFRHALTRQAVYSGLLLRERKILHRRIKEALPLIYSDALAEHYADLAYHAFQSEDWPEALRFSRLAGERAHDLFSPTTAVDHFTSALTAAAQVPGADIGPVLRSRGRSYETIGDFDRALADFQSALDIARTGGDSRAEWQAMLDIGMLWAGRDYSRAGDYLQQALEIARGMNDPSALAHSLNRVGNWYGNLERPLESAEFHSQALSIFENSGDEAGIAGTLDLLGMANLILGDYRVSTDYYRRAIAYFERLNDQAGLASSLATLPIRGGCYHGDCSPPIDTLEVAARDGYRAIEVARRIGWRSGESFALWDLAKAVGPAGHYREAFELAQRSMDIVNDIDHLQWRTATEFVFGSIYLDLLAISPALEHLERARQLASETGSLFWAKHTTAGLARALIASGDLDRCAAMLAPFPPMPSGQTMAQRQIEAARAELLLARGDAEAALEVLDGFAREAAGVEPGWRAARVALLRGDTLKALDRRGEAADACREAIVASETQGRVSILWRALSALADLEAEANPGAAADLRARARTCVEALATEIADESLRRTFLESTGLVPVTPVGVTPAFRRAAAGLTARETEVAGLVARGLSNRAIAESLVLSERTVETHVANALGKLAFTSRSQLAVWAVENGLTNG